MRASDFSINEAWIAFRLHKKPISTEEGEICFVGLLDAASGFVFVIMPTSWERVLSSPGQVQEFLGRGWKRRSEWPKQLLVSKSEEWDALIEEAQRVGISVVPTSGFELAHFAAEARESFKRHFGLI